MSERSIQDTAARKRLISLFDDGSFTEIDAYAKSANGDVEVVAGFGTVNENTVYAFSQDLSADTGAISIAQCLKIKKVYDLAVKTGCPVIGVYDSNGVKIKEGFEVLNAYGDIIKAATAMSGVCTQISIIAGASVGMSALMANMADVVIAVKDADFYVTVPSSVTASDSYSQGTVDILADDFDGAVEACRDVVSLLPPNNLAMLPLFDFAAPDTSADGAASAIEIVNAIADAQSVVELKGGYAGGTITALGTVIGTTVGFVAFDGGVLCPSCSYKTEAFVKLCDAYNIPLVTIVNTSGLKKDKENKMLTALTRLEVAYATATCPKVSLITGQAIGGAYIALAGKGANADLAFAWDSAVVSAMDVDAAVAFLYNDRLAAGESIDALTVEYKNSLASPYTAAACGAIDDVISPGDSRNKIIAALDMLSGKREPTLRRKHSVK